MKPMWCAKYKHVMIRPIEQDDIEKLRIWRNNESISTYLNPLPEITKEMQEKWYQDYVNDSNIITYAIVECDELNKMVGSVALYDFNGNTAHVGKTVIGDMDARGKNMGFWGEALALYIGFHELGITRYITEVHEENIACQKMVQKLGFDKVGHHPFGTFGFEEDFVMEKQHFEQVHEFLPNVELFER